MLDYTLAQVRAFLAAIEKQERDAMAVQFALMLVAMRGDGDEVRRLEQALRG